jgi:pyridoxamine 5'-phosphate oxidase
MSDRPLSSTDAPAAVLALTDADAGPDPFALFDRWLTDAVAAARGASEAVTHAMTLATVTPDGRPAARMVLLKSHGPAGFTFFTSDESPKARDLAAHPSAALVLHWPALERQVRVAGAVERLPRAEAEAYFATRPRGSQVGAWASAQSRPVARVDLDAAVAAAAARFGGGPVPCPPHWGGYRVVPDEVEFWQGRRDRLHDRIRFRRAPAGGFERERLSP